jgi:hypothetical protein
MSSGANGNGNGSSGSVLDSLMNISISSQPQESQLMLQLPPAQNAAQGALVNYLCVCLFWQAGGG